jgi:hypothetical protein
VNLSVQTPPYLSVGVAERGVRTGRHVGFLVEGSAVDSRRRHLWVRGQQLLARLLATDKNPCNRQVDDR